MKRSFLLLPALLVFALGAAVAAVPDAAPFLSALIDPQAAGGGLMLAAAAGALKTAGKPIEVRAIAQGYYRDTLKMPGDEFTIDDESDAGSWMVHKDGTPFTRKPDQGEKQVVIGPGGVLKVAPKPDDEPQPLKAAGPQPEVLRDANHQGPETVIGTPTPGFDAKEEAEKAAFVQRAQERAEDDEAEAEAKRKPKK